MSLKTDKNRTLVVENFEDRTLKTKRIVPYEYEDVRETFKTMSIKDYEKS